MLIAHLSDLHLCPRGHLYQGVADSNAMAEAAVLQLGKLNPEPDVVIVTGDIADHGTAAEYEVATELLSRIRQPVLVIPGNHDDREAFRACLGYWPGTARSGPMHLAAGDLGPVRILGVDVAVPGAHHGDMDDAACRWLEERLAEEPERPTIVMMHQPPLDSSIGFIDAYGCRNGSRMAEIVARFPAVERVLCGHVHRFMQARFGGTMLVTAPSTTTAIALRLQPGAQPASFLEPPALLLHHWRTDGAMFTHLVPVGDFPGPFPFF